MSGLLPRKLLIFAIILPLAAVIGYLLATPDQFDSVALVGLIVGGLLLPLVLLWHHPALIFGWQASITLAFLPGQPMLWIALVGISSVCSIVTRGLHKKEINAFVPSIAWPLLVLALLVVVTAKLTGGWGLRAAGGASYGGKRYFLLLAAIVGYFALTGQRIPIHLARRYMTIFFASTLTAFGSNLIYLLGPAFYFLYMIFPVDLALQQAFGDYMSNDGMVRLTGFALGGPALIYIMIARFGLRGIFSIAHPWRCVALVVCLFLTLLGGFRSSLVMVFLLFAIQFFFEGLHRTRLALHFAIAAVLLGCAIVPLAKHLPLSIQRSLSILPLDIDPMARYDAEATTEWRLQMWRVLWPQVPNYLLLGKGCAIDPGEMYLLSFAGVQAGQEDQASIVMGAYHSGPLTILIQFGGFAAIVFVWFIFASLKLLHHHWRHGPAELRGVNTFLLSYFLMRTIYFLFLYGHFAEDLFIFTGVIGLSVSINGRPIREPTPLRVAVEKQFETEATLVQA